MRLPRLAPAGLAARDGAGLSGRVEQVPIPEPGTVGLLGVALVGLALARRGSLQ
jgi:hypothetical protein